MHLQRARSGFVICRCTASPISWNQCSNRPYKRCDNVQPPIWAPDQTEIGTRSKRQNTAINLLTVSALSSVCAVCTAGKGSGKRTRASRNGSLSHGGWRGWLAVIGGASRFPFLQTLCGFRDVAGGALSPGGTQEIPVWQYGCHVTSLFTLSPCLWRDRVTGSCHGVLGLSSHDPWYQRGFVESGPCKTLRVLLCSDWGDLLPKTVRFLPFPWPCCYSGLWAGTAPHPAGIALGAGGLGSPSTLPAAHLTLSFLTPWDYPSVLKVAQSWDSHPPTLLGEEDPCARCHSHRSGAQHVLHSSGVILGLWHQIFHK